MTAITIDAFVAFISHLTHSFDNILFIIKVDAIRFLKLSKSGGDAQ